MARTYRLVASRTCHRALLVATRRAVLHSQAQELPGWPALAVGRLESLLDDLEAGRRHRRAVYLVLHLRQVQTLHALCGALLMRWGGDKGAGPVGSTRGLRSRAGWVLGLD